MTRNNVPAMTSVRGTSCVLPMTRMKVVIRVRRATHNAMAGGVAMVPGLLGSTRL